MYVCVCVCGGVSGDLPGNFSIKKDANGVFRHFSRLRVHVLFLKNFNLLDCHKSDGVEGTYQTEFLLQRKDG